jgi:hypothetical protein
MGFLCLPLPSAVISSSNELVHAGDGTDSRWRRLGRMRPAAAARRAANSSCSATLSLVREAAFRDLVLGDAIVTFDGRVVEFFGEHMPGRVHLPMLGMQASGRRTRGLRCGLLVQGRRAGYVRSSIAGNDWPNLEPLVAEISAALQQPGA